jgi:uncharacterized protein (TIGR01777 family)
MSTVLITGGTGMIGTSLTELLVNNGYNVIILSRNPLETAANHELKFGRTHFRASGNIYYAKWNLREEKIDLSALREADYIIHLAGAGVAEKRWTARRKKEILESRTLSSALLVKALKENPNKVRAVISASAIGYYGADQGKVFRESDPPARDFLGQTCLQWEQSIEPVIGLGKRLVKLRAGVVLSKNGGAIKEFKRPIRMGIAAILGDGKQITSWVHIDDLCRTFLEAIENPSMQGVYNVVAPSPVDHKTLTIALAKQMKGTRYIQVNVPEWLLRIMFGELSIEILKSATVSCEKIRQTGFQFVFPTSEAAIKDLVRN